METCPTSPGTSWTEVGDPQLDAECLRVQGRGPAGEGYGSSGVSRISADPSLVPRAWGLSGFAGHRSWIEPARGYGVVALSNRIRPKRGVGAC